MQVPQQTDQAEAWMLKHVELGTVGRALEGATLEQIDRALDVLDRMQPMNTQNEFWTRHELPYDLEPLEATWPRRRRRRTTCTPGRAKRSSARMPLPTSPPPARWARPTSWPTAWR